MKLARLLARIAGVALLTGALHASAQGYPNKPIRLEVPFAPGGSSEIISRAFANEMSKTLGQNVIVDNRGGAAGREPGVGERLAAETAEIITSSPKEFAAFIEVEQQRWGEVVKKANIKAE